MKEEREGLTNRLYGSMAEHVGQIEQKDRQKSDCC